MSYTPGSQDATSIRPLVVSLVNALQGLGNKAITLIWDDFHRVTEEEQIQDAVERIRRTGLGLVIAKALVEAMGGRIWFESKVGKGSAFSFSMPVASKTDLAE